MIKEFKDQYSFLSNFYPCKILLDIHKSKWISCPSVEHAFQASKTLDEYTRLTIATAPTPAKAKRLGRNVALRSDWEDVKINIMRHFIMQKFAEPSLREKLLATGDEELVEGTTWGDTFWGIDLKTGEGRNELGKILMAERERIKTINKG